MFITDYKDEGNVVYWLGLFLAISESQQSKQKGQVICFRNKFTAQGRGGGSRSLLRTDVCRKHRKPRHGYLLFYSVKDDLYISPSPPTHFTF